MLSFLFILFEYCHLFWLALRGRVRSYPKVQEVWTDRSNSELVAYFCGQLLFFVWPLALSIWHLADSRTMSQCGFYLGASAAFLTIVTLFGPVGARQRYRWLSRGRRETVNRNKRLFVGQFPATLFLNSRGIESQVFLGEILLAIVFITVTPSIIYYTVWIAQCDSFIVQNGVSSGDVGFLDFVALSITHITGAGTSSAVPKSYDVLGVECFQIILGWMYMVALLPPLISKFSENKPWWQISESRDRLAYSLREQIEAGVSALLRKREESAIWSPSLEPNPVVSAFCYRALKDSSRKRISSHPSLRGLEQWCRSAGRDVTDDLSKCAINICLGERLNAQDLHGLIRSLRRLDTRNEGPKMLAWMALSIIHPQVNRVTDLDSIASGKWSYSDDEYGRHWSTYTVLKNCLQAFIKHDDHRLDEESQQLLDRKCETGNWFGDLLLTSISVLVLRKIDRGRIPSVEAENWLLDSLLSAGSKASFVSNLNIWHTSITLETLAAAGVRGAEIDLATQWLASQMSVLDGYPGWSWSTDSNVLCLDSTTAAVAALGNPEIRNVELQEKYEVGKETVNAIFHRFGRQSLMPTFVHGSNPLHNCPIISARAVKLLRKDFAEKCSIAADVIDRVNDAQLSEWYSDRTVTQGLVLWYLAPYLSPSNQSALRLVTQLKNLGSKAEVTSVEACSAAALGLLGWDYVLREKSLQKEIHNFISRLIMTRRNDGWAGSRVNVFGFGSNYVDEHFTCVLALRALIEYQRVYGEFAVA